MSVERNQRVVGIVLLFWLVGWFVRTKYFLTYLFGHILRYPVRFDFFPDLFLSGELSVLLYFLPLLAVPALIRPSRTSYIVASALVTVTSALSAWHIDTYNDATNVTCFWVGGWLLLASVNINREDETFQWQACFLAQLIVAMVFLGGAAGKMTAAYTDGEAWRQMFLSHERFWLSGWIHRVFGDSRLGEISVIMSRLMIGAEWTMAAIPLLPYRWGAGIAITLMVFMMPVTNTILIFSVLGCMIGMLIGGWMLCPGPRTPALPEQV